MDTEAEDLFFSVDSLKQEASILEEAELSIDLVSGSGLDEQAFARLFSIYLILRDLTSAKFLWKRIPESSKLSDEMQNLWNVGRKLWERDYKLTFEAIRAFNWSSNLEKLVAL